MQKSNTRDWSREIPSSLNFSQEQMVFFIGYSLRRLYNDVFAADLREHLKALVRKFGEKYPSWIMSCTRASPDYGILDACQECNPC